MQYLLRPTDNDIVHKSHKYISRKWVNGRWRYIYKESKRQGSLKAGQRTKEQADRAHQEAIEASERSANLSKQYKEATEKANDSNLNSLGRQRVNEKAYRLQNELAASRSKEERAWTAYNKLIDDYKNTKLSAYENSSSKVKRFLANLYK